MKRVTIYDVAKEANVSLATVSRVINGVDVVRNDTRLRVEQAIEKLGYKPNAIAQGLALQKTTTIGLIIPEAIFTITGNIIHGLVDVAHVYKYNIMLYTATEGITDVHQIVERIIKSRVDGVIVYNDQLDELLIENLEKYQVPTVVINNKASGPLLASVYVDIEEAIFKLVDSYLSQGKKDVAIIEDRKNKTSMTHMINGCKRAYQKHGLTFDSYLQIPTEYHTSYEFLVNYFKENKHELIIAYRDSQALATINAALENKISIPDEMEVVCLIDTKYNAMIRPQVSAFSIPTYDLGAVAMRILTKMLKEEEIDDTLEREFELNFLFNKRQSTK